MNREYHKWWSWRLDRDMELLVFGHGGVPIVVFPSSQGRFFEYEDRGLVAAVAHKIDAGQIQLFCVDSIDAESWYNRNVPPRWRIARHVQYENYVMDEVLPLIRLRNLDPHLVALGASFGGYHAVNIAMRHPDRFTGFLSMSGAFDPSNFLGGRHTTWRTSAIAGIWTATVAGPTFWAPAGTTTAWVKTRTCRGRWARKASRTTCTSGTRTTRTTGRPGLG
jgi:esterase/lipase superfamily enzyme